MPKEHLPVDPDVKIPAAIKNAAALAEAAYKTAYGDQAGQPPADAPTPASNGEQHPQEATIKLSEEPAPQPSPPPQPQPQPVPTNSSSPPSHDPVPIPSKDDLVDDSWAGRYNSMRGRWEQSQQTIGSLQEQMTQLGEENMRLQRMLQRQPPPPPPPKPQPLITDKDVEAYGPELIDTIKRAAREAMQPDLAQIQQTTQQVRQRIVADTQRNVYQQLQTEIPNWSEINNSPRFKAWAGLRDVYSGEVRSKLLNAALQAADAPRVIAFFRGFLSEEAATGHSTNAEAQVAPRQAAVPLETLASPGKAKPASGQLPSALADKPIFTRAQVADFYSQVRRGTYVGRDADKARDEAAIFAAQREGRVR